MIYTTRYVFLRMSRGSVGAGKKWFAKLDLHTHANGRDATKIDRQGRFELREARYRKVHWPLCIDKNTKAKT